MKFQLTKLFVFFLTTTALCQTGINYKAIIKNAVGNPVTNQMVQVDLNILESDGSTVAYNEGHTPTTSDTGLVILEIGTGTTSDDFGDIEWDDDNFLLNVTVDIGAGLVDMGTSPFQYVPYAFHAVSASNVNDADADPTNEIQNLTINENTISLSSGGSVDLPWKNNGSDIHYDSGNIGINTSTPGEKLEVNGRLKLGQDTGTPALGTIQYNSSLGYFEGYTTEGWTRMGKRRTKVVIPAAAFTPRISNNYINNSTRAFYTSGAGSSHSIYAPVVVPVGARITRIHYIYYDSDGTNNLRFELRKSCGNSIGSALINSHTSTGAGNFVRNNAFSLSELVGDDECQYFVTARAFTTGTSGDWSSSMYFVKLYIEYTE